MKNMEDSTDKIIAVRKRFDSRNGRHFGYELITERFPYYPRPFIHKDWLNNPKYENLTTYVRLLKEYLKKHPELLVLLLLWMFPQVELHFPLLKSLVAKKVGY